MWRCLFSSIASMLSKTGSICSHMTRCQLASPQKSTKSPYLNTFHQCSPQSGGKKEVGSHGSIWKRQERGSRCRCPFHSLSNVSAWAHNGGNGQLNLHNARLTSTSPLLPGSPGIMLGYPDIIISSWSYHGDIMISSSGGVNNAQALGPATVKQFYGVLLSKIQTSSQDGDHEAADHRSTNSADKLMTKNSQRSTTTCFKQINPSNCHHIYLSRTDI